MNYYTLSIHSRGHDGSYSLFNNDTLVLFSHCERDTRVKYGTTLSEKSIDEIYKITKRIDLLIVSATDDLNPMIHQIVHKFDCGKIVSNRAILLQQHNDDKNLASYSTQKNFSHHDIHAISAFYMSPFDEAVCLIVDGLGDSFYLKNNGRNAIIATETASIIEVNKNFERNLLYKRLQYYPATISRNNGTPLFSYDGGIGNIIDIVKTLSFKCDISSHIDIGNMYLTISKHLGFGFNGSGKVMGLSAYGSQNNDLPPFMIGDTMFANSNFFTIDNLIDVSIHPEMHGDLSFQNKADLAYEVQRSLERVFLMHAEFIKQNSNIKNIVIGGGCALNILGVSLIKERYPEFNIFVDPIANDATQSIGLGLFFYINHVCGGKLTKDNKFDSIYKGPIYDKSDILSKVDKFLEKNLK